MKYKSNKYISIIFLALILFIFIFLFLLTFKFTKKIYSILINLENIPLLQVDKDTNNFLLENKISKNYPNLKNKIIESEIYINDINCQIIAQYLDKKDDFYYYQIYQLKDKNNELNLSKLDLYNKVYFSINNLNLWNYLK